MYFPRSTGILAFLGRQPFRRSEEPPAMPYLFGRLKALVYADGEDALNSLYNESMIDSLVTAYPRVHGHIQELFAWKPEWALCCRMDLPMHANNTNNFVESAMRMLKDSISQRTKAFNVTSHILTPITNVDSRMRQTGFVVCGCEGS